jgi:hypothetical protein
VTTPIKKPKTWPVLTSSSVLHQAASLLTLLADNPRSVDLSIVRELAGRLELIAGTQEFIALSRADVLQLCSRGIKQDLGELERFRPSLEALVKELERSRENNLPIILREWS